MRDLYIVSKHIQTKQISVTKGNKWLSSDVWQTLVPKSSQWSERDHHYVAKCNCAVTQQDIVRKGSVASVFFCQSYIT